jgi:uncharacterized SAM-binding protein YcdF (DUF218 family)
MRPLHRPERVPVNEVFMMFGIESWKSMLTPWILPPVPFFVLALVGARLMARRRGLGWSLLLLGLGALWAGSTTAVGEGLMRLLLDPPPVLAAADIAELKRPTGGSPKTTIVVLGGGRELLAPEYGMSNLKRYSMERLRYGVWLARETGLPIGVSGGAGHGAGSGPSEAEIAARIAEREFSRRLQWTEGDSRDTNENALNTIRLLEPMGYRRIVLVTHGFHMRRAVRAFERAASQAGLALTVVPAPMAMIPFTGAPNTGWLPSAEGLESTRLAIREWLGWVMGA